MFALILTSLSPLLGELHVVPSSESICSSPPPPPPQLCFLLSSPVASSSYLALLLFSRRFMPFMWEPSSPSLAALRFACAYLVVCVCFVLRVEVKGQEGGEQEDKSEQTGS